MICDAIQSNQIRKYVIRYRYLSGRDRADIMHGSRKETYPPPKSNDYDNNAIIRTTQQEIYDKVFHGQNYC